MIEDDERRPRGGAFGELLDLGLIQRLGFEQQPLVNSVGSKDVVEIARARALDGDVAMANGVRETGSGPGPFFTARLPTSG